MTINSQGILFIAQIVSENKRLIGSTSHSMHDWNGMQNEVANRKKMFAEVRINMLELECL